MLDLENVIQEMQLFIKELGSYQLSNFNKRLEIETKSSENDLVTNIDKESEKRIISFIEKKYPTHSIVGEEGADIDKDSGYCWIIDPLDGTNNFAHGFPIFTISIALQYQDEMVLGLVYYPVQDELFSALKGKGAFLNDEKIYVSKENNLLHAFLTTGFPYDKAVDQENNLNFVLELVPRIRGLRRTGSAAYDLCNLARGSIDGYWELKMNLWDIAAGKLIVEEAGGKVVINTEKKGIRVLATNQFIFHDLLEVLNKVDNSWNNF